MKKYLNPLTICLYTFYLVISLETIFLPYDLTSNLHINHRHKLNFLFLQPIAQSNKKVNTRFYTEKWSNLFEDLQRIFTVLGFTTGGLWAYFHFSKEKLYYDRIELNVFGKFVEKNFKKYLIINIKVKNKGKSTFKVTQYGTGLVVSTTKVNSQNDIIELDDWDDKWVCSVLINDPQIESNEYVEENKIIVVPRNTHIIKLRLKIVSKGIERNMTTFVF